MAGGGATSPLHARLHVPACAATTRRCCACSASSRTSSASRGRRAARSTRRSRASGGVPGGISSKLDVALRPRAARRQRRGRSLLVQPRWRRSRQNLPGTLADVDSEFLHDLRVAVRRTRSLQRQLAAVFPPSALAHFRDEFRWLQQVTGPTRDLDVQLLEFDDLARAPGRARRPRAAARAARRTAARERAAMVPRAALGARPVAAADWAAFLDGSSLPAADRPDAARPIAEVAGERIATVYRQMVKMGGAIDDDSPPEALHDLRKKGKELRYLLEFFAGCTRPSRQADGQDAEGAAGRARPLPGPRGPGRRRCARSATRSRRWTNGAGGADGDGRARRAAGRASRPPRARSSPSASPRSPPSRSATLVRRDVRDEHASSRPTTSRAASARRRPRSTSPTSPRADGARTLLWDLDPQGAQHVPAPRQAEGQGRRAASSCAARATSTR